MELERGSHVVESDETLPEWRQGSVAVQPGATAIITGLQQGSLHVAGKATARISGSVQGSVHIEVGGTVIVERGGVLSGSVFNDGDVVVQGTQAGPVLGHPLRVEGGGRVVEPEIRGGTHHYDL